MQGRTLLLLLFGAGVLASRRQSRSSSPAGQPPPRGGMSGGAAGAAPAAPIVEADPIPLGRLVPGSYEWDFSGRAQQHSAQDMKADPGTPVYAPVTGTVQASGRSYPGQASVQIKATATGLIHSLGHLAAASITVAPGAHVVAGQELAKLNAVAWSPPSSRADIGDLRKWFRAPSHLHYSIRDPRVARDPAHRVVGTINPYPHIKAIRDAAARRV